MVPDAIARYIVSKGSVAINGVSLTIATCNETGSQFKVAVIPHSLDLDRHHRHIEDTSCALSTRYDELATMKTYSLTFMYFFLDTAEIDQWDFWLTKGFFYGVTTNPTLLERARIPCTIEQLKLLADRAFQLGAQEVHLQTWGTEIQSLVERGEAIAAIDPRVVVKIPITLTGTEAATQLLHQGIRITLTGVYAVHQALIAAAINAHFAAPYLGRITDLGQDGRQQIAIMQKGLKGVNSSTKLLVASIRSVDDITHLATHGLDTFTLSPTIAKQLFQVEATDKAALAFEKAAQS